MDEQTDNRLIELTDEETGDKMTFEYLDTIDYQEQSYLVLTEYDEQQDEAKVYDVYVMKFVTEDNGEDALEFVEDSNVVNAVFDMFKDNAKDYFEFVEG
ncbi:MAG: DUF1292 domain-containing protein [Clostridiaceae bacterium]|nr:DUF1292 domain-containing protein [Clostridiaceae bacterium]